MANAVSTTDDPHYQERIVAEMNSRLFNEEEVLMKSHSDCLRREIDTIKTEMGLLN